MLPLILLTLLVPLLQLLPEPALVHQLLLVVRLQLLSGEKTLHQGNKDHEQISRLLRYSTKSFPRHL